MASKRVARVDSSYCVACGSCVKVCPLDALSIWRGVVALVDQGRCVGCGTCTRECPAGALSLADREVAQ